LVREQLVNDGAGTVGNVGERLRRLTTWNVNHIELQDCRLRGWPCNFLAE
jgi:hypothetical protein